MKTLGLWLWYLFPANPVLLRVLHGGGRRVRHAFVRAGYLGVLILLVLFGLFFGQAGAVNVELSTLAQAGSQVFAVIAYGQVVLVCLLAPIFMAGAIQQERAGETMDILLTTPLSNLQVVLGTLFGRLFFVLALLISGLPLFSVLLIFGGVPIRSVFVAFAVAGLVAITVGAVAVFLSVLRRGGRKAVFIFVIAVLWYLFGIWGADLVVRMIQAPPSSPVAVSGMDDQPPDPATRGGLLPPKVTKPDQATGPARVNTGDDTFDAYEYNEDEIAGAAAVTNEGRTTWLTPLHPLLVLEASMNKPNYRVPAPDELTGRSSFARFYLGNPLGTFVLLNVGVSACLVLLSAVQLRRLGQGESLVPMPAALRRFLRLKGPGDRRRPPRTVHGNPIAWRESHTRGKLASAILGRWSFFVLGLVLALVLIGLYHFSALPTLSLAGGPTLSQAQVFKMLLLILVLVELGVVQLVAVYMSSGTVSREREDGTLDLLLTTPVTPRQYIWGKVRGLVFFLGLFVAVPVLTLLFVSAYSMIGQWLDWPQATMAYSIVSDTGTRTVNGSLLLPEVGILLLVSHVPWIALVVSIGMIWSIKTKTVLGAVVWSYVTFSVVGGVYGCCLGLVSSVPLLGPMSSAGNVLMLMNPWELAPDFATNPLAGRVLFWVSACLTGATFMIIVYFNLSSLVRNFDHTVRRLTGTN